MKTKFAFLFSLVFFAACSTSQPNLVSTDNYLASGSITLTRAVTFEPEIPVQIVKATRISSPAMGPLLGFVPTPLADISVKANEQFAESGTIVLGRSVPEALLTIKQVYSPLIGYVPVALSLEPAQRKRRLFLDSGTIAIFGTLD